MVRRGTRAGILNASLPNSHIWPDFNIYKLTINMRVQRLLALGRDPTSQQQWADYLLRVGEGLEGDPMCIPAAQLAPTSDPRDLIRWVFGDLAGDATTRLPEVLIGKAIMTPKNDDVNSINSSIMELLPGLEHSYPSADYVGDDDDATAFPPEFLNSLQPQGMPAHDLKLKVGVPIMLLRNLSPSMGLANGTCLIVTHLSPRIIQANIVTGTRVGTSVLIPRIALTPTDSQLPFTFTRRQFPIRPAFAMTINKSQGQTFDKVGVFLPAPVFSHGQLYVADSRVGEPDGLQVMVAHPPSQMLAHLPEAEQGKYTANVVYNGIFTNLP